MVFNENTKCNKNFITKRLQTHMIIKLNNIIELIAITQYIIFIRISFKFKLHLICNFKQYYISK